MPLPYYTQKYMYFKFVVYYHEVKKFPHFKDDKRCNTHVFDGGACFVVGGDE
jgi:hypothetical protein